MLMSLAYLFLGIFLILEGLSRLGASVWNKEILQGICLTLAGICLVFSFFF